MKVNWNRFSLLLSFNCNFQWRKKAVKFRHNFLIPYLNKNKLCSMTCGRVPAKGASKKRNLFKHLISHYNIRMKRDPPFPLYKYLSFLVYKMGGHSSFWNHIAKEEGSSKVLETIILQSSCEIRWLVLSTLELYPLLSQYDFRMKRDPPLPFPLDPFLIFSPWAHHTWAFKQYMSFWNKKSNKKEK